MTEQLPSLEERYYLRIKDSTGAVIAMMNHWVDLQFTRKVNDTGQFALQLGPDDRLDDVELEGQLEIYRRVPELELGWYKEAEYLIENWVEEYRKGVKYTTLSGVGYNGILGRRIVEAPAGSAEASKSGAAETVMKEIVDEQVGSSAGAGRVYPGLSVAADSAGGNTVNRSFAHKNVLEVLKSLVKPGGLDFQVSGIGEATYEFEVYANQLGSDRRNTVLFSLKRGNMRDLTYEHKRTGTANAVRVGGKGQSTSRAFQWAIATDITAQTRREAFVNGSNEEDADLPDRADAELREKRVKDVFDFDVVQTLGSAYGEHYTLGDLVNAEVRGTVQDMKVQAVQIRVSRGERSIKPTLRSM